MIFIPPQSSVLTEVLNDHFSVAKGGKYQFKDITSHEFDNTVYRILTTNKERSQLKISVKISSEKEAKQYGVDAHMKKVFGNLVCGTESGYTASIEFDCASISAQDKKKIMEQVPLLKNHCYAPIFYAGFDEWLKQKKCKGYTIPYRQQESIYFVQNSKVFACIFSVRFNDDDDVVLGKSFLQELKDSKRVDRSLGNAPAVNFTFGGKPSIMKNAKSVRERGNLKDYSFVVFSLFERHMSEANRFQTVQKLLVFRNYLHYHLKCSKAQMHMRMRNRVQKLLQSLEAAKDMSGLERAKRTRDGKYLDVSKRKKFKK